MQILCILDTEMQPDLDPYTATAGFLRLITALNNNPDIGTGINQLINYVHSLLGPKIPESVIQYVVKEQNSLFGGYPKSNMFVPAIIFSVLFFIIGLIHVSIFIMNCSRGHYFWISGAWIFYSILKFIGFALFASWLKDITQILLGLTAEILLIIPAIVIDSANLILAQRLFTWRHPVGGSRKLFWAIMLTIYGFVAVIIGITVAASFIPYLWFLSTESYNSWQKVVMASSILIIIYTVTAVALIGMAFLWPPTTKDENLHTYQPWWIESFSPFYFVQPGAAQKAEETFMKRNHNHRHAIRVIAATHSHYKVVQGLSTERGDLKHNTSILLVFLCTIFLFVGALGRTLATFANKPDRLGGVGSNPAFMWVGWGALEVIVNLMYIIGRVDLRFYRPDVLPAKIRAIVTAEQTYYPSEDEEEVEEAEEYEQESENWNFVDVDDTSSSEQKKTSFPGRPPYPHQSEKDFDDGQSDFNF